MGKALQRAATLLGCKIIHTRPRTHLRCARISLVKGNAFGLKPLEGT